MKTKQKIQTFRNITYNESDTSLLNDDGYFQSEKYIFDRILVLNDQQIISTIVKKSQETINKSWVTSPKSKRLSGKLFEESKSESIHSKLAWKILDILCELRTPIRYKVKCDACLHNKIEWVSISGNFYCNHCKSYFERNHQFNEIQNLNNFHKLDFAKIEKIPFNRLKLADIKEQLKIIHTELLSAPETDKKKLYSLFQMAVTFIKSNEDKFEKFFSTYYK